MAMANEEPEPNLLFGVLALQQGLIDPGQFAAACAEWAALRAKPLAELLVARGWVTAEARAAVECFARLRIEKHHGDSRAALSAAAGADARAIIRRVEDPRVSCVLSPTPEEAFRRAETLDRPAGERSRYTFSRKQGEGGLGQVWVAHDGDLNREVALKEILPERAGSEEAGRRIRREAQVTGQLEHPNIVPVYELGRRPEDGEPYYTMRLIRGRGLDTAIAQYHKRRNQAKEEPLDLPDLLRAFVGVCEAIAFAHARGVIHRDLKPANVVLGDYGEAVVLDWGLAKVIGRPEKDDHPEIAFSEEARAGATQPGWQPGTPAYMAPEQALGRHDLIGTATDIYGLGTILFEILAGGPPHRGNDTAELLRAIGRDESPRARAAERSADPALDAVAARAMARDRADRYASAKELANEVKLWLDDQPVSVHRGSMATRVLRWARRHKPTVAWSGALLLTAVATLAAANLQTARERRRAEASAAEARANFRLARHASDAMLTEVGAVDLADVPQMEPVRRGLLEKARSGYRELLARYGASAGADTGVLREAGHALGRLGDILALTGNDDGAEAAYHQAIAILRPLATEAGTADDTRRDLAHALHGLGVVLKAADRLKPAEEALVAAVGVRARLAAGHPGDPADRRALADSQYQRGALLARLGRRRPDDERAYRDAIAVEAGLAEERKDRPAEHGRYLNNLGILQRAIGRTAEAESSFREAFRRQARADGSLPLLPGSRWQAARAASNLGVLLKEAEGRGDDARELFAWSRAVLERLVAEFPGVPQYRHELAAVELNLALLHHARGATAEAEEAYRRALARLDAPARPDDRRLRAEALIGLNVLLGRSGDALESSVEEVRRALVALDSLAAVAPEVPAYHLALGRGHYQLARLWADRGRPAEAVRSYQAAIACHRALLDDGTGDEVARSALGDDLAAQARLLRAQGDRAGAAGAAEELARLQPGSAGRVLDAAAILAGCAQPAGSDGRTEYLDRALRVLAQAVDRGILRDPSALDQDDFAPLRARADFQALRRGLERRASSAATIGR
jgi:serine/threonine-protein kinase